MDTIETLTILNAIQLLECAIEDLSERIDKIEQHAIMCVAYIKKSQNDKSFAKTFPGLEHAPEEDYLDELEALELAEAKKELNAALSSCELNGTAIPDKFNCTYPMSGMSYSPALTAILPDEKETDELDKKDWNNFLNNDIDIKIRPVQY